MSTAASTAAMAMGRVRFSIVAMLFVVTMVNYADRVLVIVGEIRRFELAGGPA